MLAEDFDLPCYAARMLKTTLPKLWLLSLLFAVLAASLLFLLIHKQTPEHPPEIDAGFKLMASRGARQRATAENLLRYVWEKRSSLSKSDQAMLAVRLTHLLERNADLKQAWSVLQEAMKDGLLDSCESNESASIFLCGESERLKGTLLYAFHSWPESETENDVLPCDGLPAKRNQRTSVSECLGLSKASLERSIQSWDRFGQRLLDKKVDQNSEFKEMNRAFDLAPNEITYIVRQRRAFTRLNLGLVLHESGAFDRLAEVLEVKPEDCVKKVTPGTAYACLVLARALRDQGNLKLAKEVLAGVLQMPGPPELAWRARVANATIELRNGNITEARKAIEDTLKYREDDQLIVLKNGNPFFLDRRLITTENGDDVVIEAMLEAAAAPGADFSLQRYLSTIAGSGEVFLAKRFAEWRRQGDELWDAFSSTVASDLSLWQGESLAGEKRRQAFKRLEGLATKFDAPVPFTLGQSNDIWNKAWAKMGGQAELLAVIQLRRFDYRKDITQSIGDSEYVALYFLNKEAKPVIRRIGNSSEWNDKIRTLRQGGSDVAVDNLSRILGISKTPTKRLVILGAGSFQQFPWGLLRDEAGVHLLERKTSIILANSLIEVSEWGGNSNTAVTSAKIFTNPDLQPMLALIQHTKPLQALEKRLTWTIEDEKNAEQEREAFRELFSGAEAIAVATASESSLKQIQDPRALHLRTHGTYLAEQTNVPVSDRSLMLFSPSTNDDGLLLSSEARMLRLTGTRLVTLSVCEAGEGRGRRSGLIEGFRRSFHIAGAKSVLAPLWIVDSTKAAQFMTDFFAAAQTESLDKALRSAQQEAAARPGWQSQDWAGWVLSGDPSPLHR
jgi:hypothetical protein